MDFFVSHGKCHVSQHDKSAKHSRTQKAPKPVLTMTAFIATNVSEADQVTKAELKMSAFCAKNNAASGFYDDFNNSVADIFQEPTITLNYSVGK